MPIQQFIQGTASHRTIILNIEKKYSRMSRGVIRNEVGVVEF